MFNVRPAMGLGKRIRELRQARGWTLEKLEEASGVAVGTISALEQRDSSRSQYFPALARALDVTMEQLSDPNVVTTEFTESLDLDVPMFMRQPKAPALEPIRSWEHASGLPPGEYVLVPRLSVKPSAGNGNELVDVSLDERQPQAFRADWIRKEKLQPNKLAVVDADGRSMEPTIFHGDSLLVDTSQTEVRDGQIYVLWYDGGERVKRLYRMPGGGLRIRSDSTADYPEIVLHRDYEGHVRIIGRVVHRSGGL